MPLGDGSCIRRTGHPFPVLGPEGPSQKIEYVFAASPETIRREPRELISFAQSATCRTWQPARCVILLFFSRGRRVRPPRPCDLPPARSPVLLDPQPANTPPSCELRQALRDWHSPSAFRFHRPERADGPVGGPAWRLPPALVGYACCAVWKAESAVPFRLSSFRPRRARSN